MTNRFLVLCLVLLGSSAPAGHARAQQCDASYELIFRFDEAQAGSYNVWDHIYGDEKHDERMVSAVADGVLAVSVGGRYAENGALERLVFAAVDRRGRLIWDKSHEIKGLTSVSKIMKVKEGFVVVGEKSLDARRKAIWFGFFDKNADFLRHKLLTEAQASLEVDDVIEARDGQGYVVAASYQSLGAQGYGDQKPSYSVLYRVSSDIGVQKQSSYLPGSHNAVLGLSKIGESDYIATGYVEGADKRTVGWVMRLGPEFHILWQRQYPRGAHAELSVADVRSDGDIVVGGVAHPLKSVGGHNAGWVMALDERHGEILWQRYYVGQQDYNVEDLMAHEDGQISVMMPAISVLHEEQNFVRLLTLNARGYVLLGDSYFEGVSSHAKEMILGANKERLLVGSARKSYTIEGVAGSDDMVIKSYDGWLVSGVPVKSYNDPCQ